MEIMSINGTTLALDQDGHLANANDWNEEVARQIAASEGILAVDPTTLGCHQLHAKRIR